MGPNIFPFTKKNNTRTKVTPVPGPYNRSYTHWWSDLPPANNSKVATTDNNTRNINSKSSKILNRSTNNINRVISFHSSSIWKEYFQATKHSDKLMVIFFKALWSFPCLFMGPILDEFATQYTDVEFDKIDVDELPGISQEFGVEAMPTFVFVKRGHEIDRVTGARREELQWKIEKHRD